MTRVAILPEPSLGGETEYRAVARGRQSVAKTAGAALDALAAQLPADERGTIVIVQNHQADEFFSARQQQRISELMTRWRVARNGGPPLSALDQEELERLIEAEVQAAGKRAAAALAEMGQ